MASLGSLKQDGTVGNLRPSCWLSYNIRTGRTLDSRRWPASPRDFDVHAAHPGGPTGLAGRRRAWRRR
ncbi:hypothetical protein E2C01_033749 [Portunus trituberculatus]|uniref:Uncharacterized protein n=1 Tax=Portunus trituberculatus TaxID=210409 RepID=A0A5B7F501_PORTR|nr:hypothetical protein [Portunus trituberculatus]